MDNPEPILSVSFFRTETGREPVREWLKGLPREQRRIIGEDIKTVQFGWPLGMPLVRKLDRNLWEVRIRLPDGRRGQDDSTAWLHQEIAENSGGRLGTGENPPASATMRP